MHRCDLKSVRSISASLPSAYSILSVPIRTSSLAFFVVFRLQRSLRIRKPLALLKYFLFVLRRFASSSKSSNHLRDLGLSPFRRSANHASTAFGIFIDGNPCWRHQYFLINLQVQRGIGANDAHDFVPVAFDLNRPTLATYFKCQSCEMDRPNMMESTTAALAMPLSTSTCPQQRSLRILSVAFVRKVYKSVYS